MGDGRVPFGGGVGAVVVDGVLGEEALGESGDGEDDGEEGESEVGGVRVSAMLRFLKDIIWYAC